MTVPEYEELIAFLRQHISDLTEERDRLKSESTNASEALMASNESNAALCVDNNDMRDALALLGVTDDDNV